MPTDLSAELEFLASRAWEAPVSAQTRLLDKRRKILHFGTATPKLLAALLVLPILSLTLWVLIFVTAPLAKLSILLNRKILARIRGHLAHADLDTLGVVLKSIDSHLPKLEELKTSDQVLRTKSEFYNWYVAGFDAEIETFILEFEEIREAIEIGIDPKWRSRLCEPEMATHVA
jgi:hypothetical protein